MEVDTLDVFPEKASDIIPSSIRGLNSRGTTLVLHDLRRAVIEGLYDYKGQLPPQETFREMLHSEDKKNN